MSIEEDKELLDTERKLFRAISNMFPHNDMPVGFFDRLTDVATDEKSMQTECIKLASEYGFVYKPYSGFIRGSIIGH